MESLLFILTVRRCLIGKKEVDILESLSLLASGFTQVFTFGNILWIFGGTLAGIILGAIPGLTGALGVALLVPVTFTVAPIPSICMLLGVYCGGTYGGSITAILINTPGSAASWMTAADGYTLAQQGKSGRALRMALYASTMAGLISCALLIFISPLLARFALLFGPAEYLAMVFLGLMVVASISGDSLPKGVIAAACGLLAATIGQEPYAGLPRLTFGNLNLYGGLNQVAVLIGLFAIPEILSNAEKIGRKDTKIELPRAVGDQHLGLREFLSYWKTIVKGSLLGAYIGAIPGIGASVATVVSYNEAMRVAPDRSVYGKGSMDGIAAAESGNNGVTGATLIPLLTMGIPGDIVTGILLSAFTIQGLTPGPLLFQEQGETVYAIFAGLVLVNLAMLILGSIGMPFFPYLNYIPGQLMFPIIFVICCIGSYAAVGNSFQLLVVLAVGVYGYIGKKCGLPSGAFVIAFLLGALFETNLQRALLLFEGNILMIFTKPIAVIFIVLSIASTWYMKRKKK